MKKHPFTPLALMFALLLAAMPLMYFLLPWQTYSEEERRVLAEPPAFSWDHWSDDAEAFLADHLPLRKVLTGLNGISRQVLGMNVLDDVWRLPSGRLVEAPLQRDDARMLRNADRLAAFAEKTGLPLYLLAVPSAGAVCGEETYQPYPDAELLSLLEEREGVTLIQVMDDFAAADIPLYYATDPHWNGEGVYRAYVRAGETLGFTPLARDDFAVTASEGFLGTCYTRSALWGMEPDNLEMWDAGFSVSVTMDETETASSMFYMEHLQGGDQYPVFLDGNHGLTQIVNHDAPDAPNLLIFKDSFGNSLSPLLAAHYHTITLVDLRAYRGNAAELAAAGDYQAILAVYSLERLTHDTNFAWLR